MQRSLLALAILTAGSVSATPFVGNDSRSSAMGNTGVASADSFAASQFNPALLSAYDDGIDFGLQLPSLKFSIDDGYGFLEETDIADEFENTDTDAIILQVNGSASVKSLDEAVTDMSDASDDLSNNINQTNIDNFNDANETLSNKINIIDTEMNNLDVAINNTNDSLSTLPEKPLALLFSGGGAVAIPRSGLGLALHLNTSANAGMRANIAQSDLDQVSNVTNATTGFTSEATEMSDLSTALGNASNNLSKYEGIDPCGGSSPDGGDDWNAFLEAQADLEAETSGANVTVGGGDNYCGGSYTATSDGTNVNNYDSGDGIYVNGELQASATEGLGEDSSITILGANVIELGVSASREFTYMGQTFYAGVTPKLLSLQIFEDEISFNDASFDSSSLNQNTTTAFAANVDLGIAKNWYNILGGQVRAGMAVKDLIPLTFESSAGRELEMGPKVRIGAAHDTRFSTVALDVDLTENEPLGYGVPTRYIGLGGEFDAFNWVKLRAGYRNNLAIDDSHVVTTGLGFTPFGVGLDFSAWLSPASEVEEMLADAGIAAQFSMNW